MSPKSHKERAVVGAISALIRAGNSSEIKVYQAVLDKECDVIFERQIIAIDAAIDPEKDFVYETSSFDFDSDEEIDVYVNIYDINNFN